ncbi:MAG: ketoacyl-ACP synthase III [Anaerolineaceae bacterium]|nr:MAG: ketoacyl-ACP synthase III [Anaerolineaceae bacterium]
MARRKGNEIRQQSSIYAHIVGWGMQLPKKALTNEAIAAIIDTSDEWIKARTGINERRIADEQETTAWLGLQAAKNALALTNILPGDVDLVIVATSTPENIFPSTASLIQHWLGAKSAGAFDLSAACSGFVYAVDMAAQAIRSGSIEIAIVIGTETMSRVLDWQDRGTCILFGDGAGAVVLQAAREEGGVLSSVLRSDGGGADLLAIPTLNSTEIRSTESIGNPKLHKMYMHGSEVFRFATRVIGDSVREACRLAGITIDDVKLIIPHQANERIIQAAARSLDVEPERFMSNLSNYGNTSAASIPLALCDAVHEKRINAGDYIVLVGFGGGLTWASMAIRWSLPQPGEVQVSRMAENRRRIGYWLVKWRVRFRRLWRFLTWRGDDDLDS